MKDYLDSITKIKKNPNNPDSYIELSKFYSENSLFYDSFLTFQSAYFLTPANSALRSKIDSELKILEPKIKDFNSTGRSPVFSWGKNDDGCCGVDKKYVTIPMAIENFNGITILDLACGMSHSLAISLDGRAYVWGTNNYGQCGFPLTIPKISKPQLIESLIQTPLKAVACGGAHSIVISHTGQVFSWGLNSLGQCGFDSSSEKIVPQTPIKTGFDSPIKAVTCGLGHTIFLNENGAVYVCGWNINGQLGLGDMYKTSQTVKTPTKLDLAKFGNSQIIHAACGGNHSVFITATGGAYSTGLNSSGQLGLIHMNDVCIPTKIENLAKVQATYASCGEEFSFVVTYEKEVYGFGLNNVGQLGVPPSDFEFSPIPLLVSTLLGKQIESISCGKGGAIASTSEGESYCWGLKPLSDLKNTELHIVKPQKIAELSKLCINEIKSGREFYLILQNCTDPVQSIVYSQSFTGEILPNTMQEIYIQCVDMNGNYITQGGDRIHCILTNADNAQKTEFKTYKIKDNNDGSYNIEYSLSENGSYLIYILCNGKIMSDTSYLIRVYGKTVIKPDIEKCGLLIKDSTNWLKYEVNEEIEFEVLLYDKNYERIDPNSILKHPDLRVFIDENEISLHKSCSISHPEITLQNKGTHKIRSELFNSEIPIFLESEFTEKYPKIKHMQISIEILAGFADPLKCKIQAGTFKIPGYKELVTLKSGEIQDYLILSYDSEGFPTMRTNNRFYAQCEKNSIFSIYVSQPIENRKNEARVTFKPSVCGIYKIQNKLGEKDLENGEIIIKVINGKPDYLFSKVYGDICFKGYLKIGEKLVRQIFIDAVDSYGNKCENQVNLDSDIEIYVINEQDKKSKSKLKIEKHNKNIYKSEYSLQLPGKYKIEVIISGEKAIGSPYEVIIEKNPIEIELEKKAKEDALKKLEEMQKFELQKRQKIEEELRKRKEEKRNFENEKLIKDQQKELEKRKMLMEKIKRLEEFKQNEEQKRKLQEQKLKEKLEKKHKKFKRIGGGFVVPFLEQNENSKEITLKLQNFFTNK